MTIQVESFFHEKTNTVSHLVWESSTPDCVIIDPALDFDLASGRIDKQFADKILATVAENNLRVVYQLETHVHADHLSAAPYLKSQTQAPIMIGDGVLKVEQAFANTMGLGPPLQKLSPEYFDRVLKDDERLKLGETDIQVIATPGHTPACVSYCIGDCVFVGDTLFMPDFGTARSDFPGGDARQLYRSIKKLLSLPDKTRLFMCHDYKAPGRSQFAWQTSVLEQRKSNIHINDSVSEDEFVTMREARDKTLSMPALMLPSVQVNLRGGLLPKADANGIQYLKIPLNQF